MLRIIMSNASKDIRFLMLRIFAFCMFRIRFYVFVGLGSTLDYQTNGFASNSYQHALTIIRQKCV